uniref:Uncharacterized protein n=1 Tax=Amphora coffeiformis TaxID=265554 RepID=A0A7S3KXZ1_9STRA|mmetsp:Transcript_12726/g.24186  ORF Transcript_12726/g.24186 Transcript_12726/m.24186 type:complete len:246 (+) Transcript_12726:74-811(+)|eukprot:scaffold34601_cov234-Amphora_coffeaeformis.AAC.18
MTTKYDYLGNMSMEELDALSSSDENDSSSDDPEVPPVQSLADRSKSSQRKTTLQDFAGFEEGADADDPIAQKMQSILSLRILLRMDDDKEFMEEQEEKLLERMKLAKMTPEEHLKSEEEKTGNLLLNIKNKFEIEGIKRRETHKKEASSAKLAVAKEELPSSELKECDTTASESGSLSDEFADQVDNDEFKKDKKHRKDKKHKKKKDEKKSKQKKLRDHDSERKKELIAHNESHSSHTPKRLDAI